VAATFVAFLLALALPTTAFGHAELDTATPADGATVEGSPAEVSGTFTQDMAVDGSSMQLRDEGGEVIAKGAVDPDDPRRMAIEDLPVLEPGEYEVRWTTNSSEDDEIARGTWTFTVIAAATPTPAPTPTAAPTQSPSATPEVTTIPSATASAEPSAASAAPSADTGATPAPAPSGDTGTPAAGTMDVVVPIVAGLAIVLVVAVVLLRRRSSPTA
jgi:hypothetical protein